MQHFMEVRASKADGNVAAFAEDNVLEWNIIVATLFYSPEGDEIYLEESQRGPQTCYSFYLAQGWISRNALECCAGSQIRSSCCLSY